MIARRVDQGHAVEVVVATIGDVHNAGKLKSSARARRAELRLAARLLGIAEPKVLFEGRENHLDELPLIEIVTRLDSIIDKGGFDQIFFPYPSHHQDHRVVYEACRSALRPKGRPGPALVALYEYPYVGWSAVNVSAGRYYVDIGAVLERKKNALQAYRSQLCPAQHPISWESAEALARMRGAECGLRYAELYYVLLLNDPTA